ncbi:hypothetical protein JCM11251_003402 [Rhodosporidiobolus azoricus]
MPYIRPYDSDTLKKWLKHVNLARLAPKLPCANTFLSSLWFTHGDVVGRNIMMDAEPGHLTGLLDWEFAGWWPAEVEQGIVPGHAGEEYAFLWSCLSGL